MPGIKDRVAIIGMGCTPFGEHWDKNVDDLIVDACYEAIEDAGIETKDIQAAWWGTMDSGELGRALAVPLKLDYIPITRVENRCASSIDALRNASYAVAAGIYDLVLVCGGEKLKDSGFPGVGLDPRAPYTSRVDPEMSPPAAFAQIATRYFHRYNLDPEKGKRILAQIAVKNHQNGTLSPKAHFQKAITLEQAMKAPIVSWPLGLLDCCPVSDGAAAAIVTRADLAKKFRKDYVLVKGIGLTCGAYQTRLQQGCELAIVEENVRASRMAYKDAGITNPRKELDLAIVHDCFTIHELTIYEDFGFSERGKGWEDVEAGTFTMEGELPVNTDGGLKCFGHPVGASGLRMTYEVYKQLQGKAGSRQLKKADLGLAHCAGGTPILSLVSSVIILGK